MNSKKQEKPSDRELTEHVIPVIEEEIILDKKDNRSWVVEEVKVGKKVHERQEKVQESKRKTEVDIDHDVTNDERSADERTRNERFTRL